jgi:thiol-disulfide isomerase/thioredoxin
MKYITLYFSFLLTTAFIPTVNESITHNETANSVLQKTYDKLSIIQTLKYDYYREINYKSEDYRAEYACTKFLDFQNKDSIIGFTFQLDNEQSKQVYNGKENFILDKKKKSLNLNSKSTYRDFTSLSAFLNSILTLKQAIPSIISDNEIEKTLKDTTIQNIDYYLVTLTSRNKVLSSFGKFESITIKRDFYYKLFIDKSSFIPQKIIQTNNAEPNDFMLTDFKNISFDIPRLTELSWYYSSYLNDFKILNAKETVTIKAKTKAPNFNLENVNKKDSLKLSSLKGNIVLLEFWIKNCGYCISAVPKLNSLITKFEKRKFKVVGINSEDNNKDIELFYKRNIPDFKTVVGNSKINESYGIKGFPTVVLIDKKGIVLYSGNLDIEKLQTLIKNNL